jgi:predicted RNase H-like HicB family nuclease
MNYVVVIEKAGNNWSAYVPDLPGCIATGRTKLQAYSNIRGAIKMHIDGLREDGMNVPRASAHACYIKSSRTRVRRPSNQIAANNLNQFKA